MPAPRPSPRREAAQKAMLDVAIALLGTDGYRGMTLAAVGRESGYSHGLATMYFGSKAELAKAVAVETDRRYFQHLVESSADAPSGLDAVRQWVNGNFEFVNTHPGILRAAIVVLVEAATTVRDVRPVYDGLADRNARMLNDALKRGMADGSVRSDLDSDAASLTISGAIAGVNYQWLGNPRLDLERRRLAIIQMIDAMVGAGPTKRRRTTKPRAEVARTAGGR
jgi:AcrR family transcriptional regulator